MIKKSLLFEPFGKAIVAEVTRPVSVFYLNFKIKIG
jgi:hypothetical protein